MSHFIWATENYNELNPFLSFHEKLSKFYGCNQIWDVAISWLKVTKMELAQCSCHTLILSDASFVHHEGCGYRQPKGQHQVPSERWCLRLGGWGSTQYASRRRHSLAWWGWGCVWGGRQNYKRDMYLMPSWFIEFVICHQIRACRPHPRPSPLSWRYPTQSWRCRGSKGRARAARLSSTSWLLTSGEPSLIMDIVMYVC